MRIDEIDVAIKAVCPIDGCNSNGTIFFQEAATAQERAAAQAIMDANLPTLDLSPAPAAPPAAAALAADLSEILQDPNNIAALKHALGLP